MAATKEQNAKLDDLVLKEIDDVPRRQQVIHVNFRHHHTPQAVPLYHGMLDRSLQRLRKAGKIKVQSGRGGGWVRVSEPPQGRKAKK